MLVWIVCIDKKEEGYSKVVHGFEEKEKAIELMNKLKVFEEEELSLQSVVIGD